MPPLGDAVGSGRSFESDHALNHGGEEVIHLRVDRLRRRVRSANLILRHKAADTGLSFEYMEQIASPPGLTAERFLADRVPESGGELIGNPERIVNTGPIKGRCSPDRTR